MERAGLTHVRSLFKKGYSTFVRMDALGTNGAKASHTRGGSTPTSRSTLALSPDPTPPDAPPASLDPKHDGLTQLAERLTPTVAFGATSPAQAHRQGEARFHFFGYFDKSPWSSDGNRLLTHEASFYEHDMSVADGLELGVWSHTTGWRRFSTTHAWNFQRASMPRPCALRLRPLGDWALISLLLFPSLT